MSLIMKKYFLPLTAWFALLAGCQETENKAGEFTGNEATYPLAAGNDYAVYGHVTFKERTDGSTLAVVQVSGTEGNRLHPVHLHRGDIATPDAEIALLMNPVQGATGRSETLIRRLADETPVTYAELISMHASVKIHLAESGPERDIILAGGNIGTAYSRPDGRMRAEIAVCKSE